MPSLFKQLSRMLFRSFLSGGAYCLVAVCSVAIGCGMPSSSSPSSLPPSTRPIDGQSADGSEHNIRHLDLPGWVITSSMSGSSFPRRSPIRWSAMLVSRVNKQEPPKQLRVHAQLVDVVSKADVVASAKHTVDLVQTQTVIHPVVWIGRVPCLFKDDIGKLLLLEPGSYDLRMTVWVDENGPYQLDPVPVKITLR